MFWLTGDSSDEDDAAASTRMSLQGLAGDRLNNLNPGTGESSVLMSFVNKTTVDWGNTFFVIYFNTHTLIYLLYNTYREKEYI